MFQKLFELKNCFRPFSPNAWFKIFLLILIFHLFLIVLINLRAFPKESPSDSCFRFLWCCSKPFHCEILWNIDFRNFRRKKRYRKNSAVCFVLFLRFKAALFLRKKKFLIMVDKIFIHLLRICFVLFAFLT